VVRGLTPRQDQVLEFVATFVADEGYMPATRDIALACGLRSPSSAARACRSLETRGHIERDPKHPRLVTVHRDLDCGSPAPPATDVDSELLICELTIAEVSASVLAVQRAMTWAPDVAAQEQLHRDGLDRIWLLRLYEDARRRLVQGGAVLPEGAAALIEAQRALATTRMALVSSWPRYQTWRLLFTVMVQGWLDQVGKLGARHLASAYAAERATFAIDRDAALGEARHLVAVGGPDLARFVSVYGAEIRKTATLVGRAMPKAVGDATLPEIGGVVDDALGVIGPLEVQG
jgi:hypothetical protein